MRRDDESGAALLSVIMSMGALIVIVSLLYQVALSNHQHAQYERREDTILVGAEAMLERYAAKLTIDPLYYRHYVDEAELARRCTDASSAYYNQVTEPGNAWFDDCVTWEYEEPGTYFEHPLLQGSANAADDVSSLLMVNTEGAHGGIEVTVVSKQEEYGQTRAITAEIKPEAISEFAFFVEDTLRFGSGAVVEGMIYTGGDLDFATSPVRGIVYRDIHAEGRIGTGGGYGAPLKGDPDVVFYDGHGEYEDIRLAYPEPFDFDKLWEDLALIRSIACNGGGLCLSRADNPGLGLSQTPTAWLIEPIVTAGQGQLRVSVAYSNQSYYCVSSAEWWWLHSQDASWQLLGTFDIPDNGAVWVDGHTVIGQPGQTSVVAGQVTIYAGRYGAEKSIVIAGDILYNNGTSGTDVLGLISSDVMIINPNGVGSDNEMTISGALLVQTRSLRVARDCGDTGDVVLPLSHGEPIAELTTIGARAARETGDMAAHFGIRNYVFDLRLESLRPPLFPLVKDTWDYVTWTEGTIPCWARDTGCS